MFLSDRDLWMGVLLTVMMGLLWISSAHGQVVYSENFDKKLPRVPLDGWVRYDEPLAEGKPSLWVTKAFQEHVAIAQISNIYLPGSTHRGTWLVREKERWRDGRIEVSMTCTDDDVVGLLFRYVDSENFYVFDMTEQKRSPETGHPDSRWARIRKCLNGQYTLLALAEEQRTYHNNDGIWHTLAVEMQGAHFRAFFDDKLLLEAEDAGDVFWEGTIGLSAWAQSSVLFDDLRVDGVLVDDFNRDVQLTTPEGWSAYEEPGAREGPAHWQVGRIGDELALIQHSNVYKATEERRGTWIVLEDYTWSRLTFDWDMLHTDDDVAGVLFHYRDPENFYILEMTLQPRTPEPGLPQTPWMRLRKVVAGEYTTLGWTAELTYQRHVWQHGRIAMDGGEIRVWLDEQLALEVVDPSPDPGSGTIGFSTYAHQRVAFDNVRVAGVLAVETGFLAPRMWAELKR